MGLLSKQTTSCAPLYRAYPAIFLRETRLGYGWDKANTLILRAAAQQRLACIVFACPTRCFARTNYVRICAKRLFHLRLDLETRTRQWQISRVQNNVGQHCRRSGASKPHRTASLCDGGLTLLIALDFHPVVVASLALTSEPSLHLSASTHVFSMSNTYIALCARCELFRVFACYVTSLSTSFPYS